SIAKGSGGVQAFFVSPTSESGMRPPSLWERLQGTSNNPLFCGGDFSRDGRASPQAVSRLKSLPQVKASAYLNVRCAEIFRGSLQSRHTATSRPAATEREFRITSTSIVIPAQAGI